MALHRPTDLTLVGHMLIVVHFCHSRYVKHHHPTLTMLIIEAQLYRMVRLCYSLWVMKVTILSRQESLYSTRRLVEACRHRGHLVNVIDPLALTLELLDDSELLDAATMRAIIPRIGASITEFGCALLRQLELEGHWALNPAIGISRSRDKLLSMQLLYGRGVRVPRTAVVGQPKELERAIAAVGGLPVVLKIRRGTQGRGVVLARTLPAARRVYSVLSDFQQYTLVQEYVQEAHNQDLRVIIVGRRAVAAMVRQAPPGDFRANLHRGGHARPVHLDRDIRDLAVRAAQVHELAFCGVDIIQTARGPAVLEVNSSPGLKGIETATGIDVADAVIEYMERRWIQKWRRNGRGQIGLSAGTPARQRRISRANHSEPT
jgi:ribosomal protein S6--L-glutamate ligase